MRRSRSLGVLGTLSPLPRKLSLEICSRGWCVILSPGVIRNQVTRSSPSPSTLHVMAEGKPYRYQVRRTLFVQVTHAFVFPEVPCSLAEFYVPGTWYILSYHPKKVFKPFRTAVPFLGQTTQSSSSLSPKWDCGPEGAKKNKGTLNYPEKYSIGERKANKQANKQTDKTILG